MFVLHVVFAKPMKIDAQIYVDTLNFTFYLTNISNQTWTDYEGFHSRVAIRFGKLGRINQKFGKQYVS